MLSRRDFLQVSMAASSLYGASGFGNWAKLAAQQKLNENQLLEFEVMPSAISSSFFNRSNCFSSKLRWPESTISIYTLEGFNGFYAKSGL